MMSPKIATDRISSALAGLRCAHALQVAGYEAVANLNPTFAETPLTSPICEFALPLVARFGDEQWEPSGTAIIIGPYLALTARHVIEDFVARHGAEATHPDQFDTRFSMQACQIVDGGAAGLLWNITRLWYPRYTDIAILRLTPTTRRCAEHRWRGARLRFLPPAVGEPVSAFGYRESFVNITDVGDGIEVRWHDKPTTTSGSVTAHHLTGRDRFRLTFPCFETDARFDGGMSGGPVFTADGHLCGLICSNLPPSEPGDRHVSYVSLLFPAMACEMDLQYEGFPIGWRYPLLELVRRGVVQAVDQDRVALLGSGATAQVALDVARPPHATKATP